MSLPPLSRAAWSSLRLWAIWSSKARRAGPPGTPFSRSFSARVRSLRKSIAVDRATAGFAGAGDPSPNAAANANAEDRPGRLTLSLLDDIDRILDGGVAP